MELLATASRSLRASRGVSGDEQLRRYRELERALSRNPEPPISEHLKEDRGSRLRRWLRGMGYDVDLTVLRLHEHARWWKSFDMDSFVPEDELDETGPLFVCGEDLRGAPTMVARPCVHVSPSREYSIRTVRRCVYTLQRCIDRLPPGAESIITIFDAAGTGSKNLDLVFARELVAALRDHFPERMSTVLIINNHWTTGFFWAAISPLLDASVKAKIRFLGCSNLAEKAKDLLPSDHPYLRYCAALAADPKSEVPIPPRTDLSARANAKPTWDEQVALMSADRDLKAAEDDDEWEWRSTAASESDLRSISPTSVVRKRSFLEVGRRSVGFSRDQATQTAPTTSWLSWLGCECVSRRAAGENLEGY